MLLHITAFIASLLMQLGFQPENVDLTEVQANAQRIVAAIQTEETVVEETEEKTEIEVAVIDEPAAEVEVAPAADMDDKTVEPAPATDVVEELIVESEVTTVEEVVATVEVTKVVEPAVVLPETVVAPTELDSIADVWPTLSDSTRQSILMLIEADKLTQE